MAIKHIQRQEINIWWPEFFTGIDHLSAATQVTLLALTEFRIGIYCQ